MRPEIHQVDSLPSYEAQQHYSPNVLIVGETGVGKSSVVNLIAGEPLATVHSGAGACTMEATSYDIILPDDQGLAHHIRLFDTVGLNEPQFGKTDYLTAIEKANTLICQLQRTGGIRLLLFCIRGGRITAVMQKIIVCSVMSCVRTRCRSHSSSRVWRTRRPWRGGGSIMRHCLKRVVFRALHTRVSQQYADSTIIMWRNIKNLRRRCGPCSWRM